MYQALVCIAQSVAAVSPGLANADVLKLRKPIFFQNDPRTITASQTLVSVSTRLFNVAPCLITLAETGVRINPSLIGVCPFLLIYMIMDSWQLHLPPLPEFALLDCCVGLLFVCVAPCCRHSIA